MKTYGLILTSVFVLLASNVSKAESGSPPKADVAAVGPQDDQWAIGTSDPQKNQQIAAVRAMPFDRAKAEGYWTQTMKAREKDRLKTARAKAKLSDEQLDVLAEGNVSDYRASRTDEQFDSELRSFWSSMKYAKCRQIADGPDSPKVADNDPAANDFDILPYIVGPWGAGRIESNIEGMSREPGAVAKIIRISGVSIKDIEAYGLQGGENSFARDVIRILPIPGGDGRVFGGDNSFFHKNLGVSW